MTEKELNMSKEAEALLNAFTENKDWSWSGFTNAIHERFPNDIDTVYYLFGEILKRKEV